MCTKNDEYTTKYVYTRGWRGRLLGMMVWGGWFVRVSLFYIPIQMYGREVRDAARTAYNRPKQLVKGDVIGAKEMFVWYNWKYTKRNNIGLPQCVPHD